MHACADKIIDLFSGKMPASEGMPVTSEDGLMSNPAKLCYVVKQALREAAVGQYINKETLHFEGRDHSRTPSHAIAPLNSIPEERKYIPWRLTCWMLMLFNLIGVTSVTSQLSIDQIISIMCQ